MKKEWKLVDRILSGGKTVETRWYRTRRVPWGRIRKGDVVWFSEGGLVRARATVRRVEQFEIHSDRERLELLERLGRHDLGTSDEKVWQAVEEYTKGKKYCVAVWLENPESVTPFKINKKGHGAMSAWIVVDDIRRLKPFMVS